MEYTQSIQIYEEKRKARRDFMKKRAFKKIVREALQLPNAKVNNLGIIGGMTNLNHLVEVDGKRYVVRIPGNGTSAFINRSEELFNLKIGSSLGINPELIYFNMKNGIKITREVEQAKTMIHEEINQELLEKVANIFRLLHTSEEKMTNQFPLFTTMMEYESLALQANSHFYEGFKEVKEEVLKLQVEFEQTPFEQTPCHIDPAPSNFLIAKNKKVYLIDWEYGGMFDALWDVAAFSLEAGLSLEQEHLFYHAYFGKVATEKEKERLLMHKIFQDYLWSVWTLFKESNGDNFGLYGRHRFERAKENIQKYKRVYELKSDAQ